MISLLEVSMGTSSVSNKSSARVSMINLTHTNKTTKSNNTSTWTHSRVMFTTENCLLGLPRSPLM